MSTSVVIYQLKIGLKGTQIWRRIRIPEHFSFGQLHMAICQSFNWKHVSRHQFKCAWGKIDDVHSIVEIFDEIMDTAHYTIYNSVEKWMHTIRFERRIQFRSANVNQTHAICTSGRWARPPERCGGLENFNVIRNIYANASSQLFDAISLYVSELSAIDAEWTKLESKKIGPIILSV